MASVGGCVTSGLIDGIAQLVHAQLLPDDSGRGDEHLFGKAADGLGAHAGHFLGVAEPDGAGRGVGAT